MKKNNIIKNVTLADLSLEKKGFYGIGAKAVPYSKSLLTYLRITDINDDGTINLKNLKSVIHENAKDYILKPNDIVFARTGASTGRNYFYDGTDGTLVYAGFLIKFSIDEKKVNPKYIKYFCQSKQYKDWINSFNTGSTRGNINAQTLGRMPIPLIPRNTQNILVKILSSIDNKIKLNNKINENLEEQAKAIFKSWFIDFELFNKTKPSDWNYGTIQDLASEIVCGKTPSTKKKEYYGEDIPFITIPDMHNSVYTVKTERSLSLFGADSQPTKTLPKNSICVSCIGTAGLVTLVSTPSQTNQQINSIIPKENVSPYFVYLLMKTKSDEINKYGQSGSTIVNLNKTQFAKLECIIPSTESLIEFNDLLEPLFNKILVNMKENIALTNLRDTLLPKLMSGEIEVSEIEV